MLSRPHISSVQALRYTSVEFCLSKSHVISECGKPCHATKVFVQAASLIPALMLYTSNSDEMHDRWGSSTENQELELVVASQLKLLLVAGDRLKEGASVNKGLSALGDVISALCRGDKHIPFRCRDSFYSIWLVLRWIFSYMFWSLVLKTNLVGWFVHLRPLPAGG